MNVLYGFFVIHHDRRRILHFNETYHPTVQWAIQQLREAFPFDSAPRHLIFDRDSIFCPGVAEFMKALGAEPSRLEAKAHVSVQQWIDNGGLRGRALTAEGLCEIHRRFGELLPEELLWVEEPDTGERLRVVPGELRQRDVKVGRHIPISPVALPRFLERFENV